MSWRRARRDRDNLLDEVCGLTRHSTSTGCRPWTGATAGQGGRQSAARASPFGPGRVRVGCAPEAKPWSQTAVLWGSVGSWEAAGVAGLWLATGLKPISASSGRRPQLFFAFRSRSRPVQSQTVRGCVRLGAPSACTGCPGRGVLACMRLLCTLRPKDYRLECEGALTIDLLYHSRLLQLLHLYLYHCILGRSHFFS